MSPPHSIQNISPEDPAFPERLRHIPQPPKQLYVASSNWESLLERPSVAVVGSRKVTAYGKAITEKLVSELAKAGVVIVSGLAYGVDAIAHRAALQAGGATVAVLPTSIAKIYPAGHVQLANTIQAQGGALISEYATGSVAYKGNFVERNRIVSGLADALLVTEAAAKSGTLHTASFALEQGKDIFAVPGNITSPMSEGTNNLIKTGAALVTSSADILAALGVTTSAKVLAKSNDPAEQNIIDCLAQGMSDGAAILTRTNLAVQPFNQALTMLEIKGVVRGMGGNQWQLV